MPADNDPAANNTQSGEPVVRDLTPRELAEEIHETAPSNIEDDSSARELTVVYDESGNDEFTSDALFLNLKWKWSVPSDSFV